VTVRLLRAIYKLILLTYLDTVRTIKRWEVSRHTVQFAGS